MTAPKRAEIEQQIAEIERQLRELSSGLVEAWIWSPIGRMVTPGAAHAALAGVGIGLPPASVRSAAHRSPGGKKANWFSFQPSTYQPPAPWQRLEIPTVGGDDTHTRWVHPDLLALDY